MSAPATGEISRALDGVRARIAAAARRAGRAAEDVTLVAVTKGVAPEAIARAFDAGVRDVGENRVQEMHAKQDALPDLQLRWHFVGTLQRNKVRAVAGRVALVHSVGSVELARALGERASAAGTVQEVLVQVNTSGESDKHGVEPADAVQTAHAVASIPGVRLRGLMTIAAPGDRGAARACFAELRALRDRVAVPGADELSMGMTQDLEEAVEEGATIVRVGTAIFGARAR